MENQCDPDDSNLHDDLEPITPPITAIDVNERRTTVDLRSLLLVMKRAAREDRLMETLAPMLEFSRANPEASLLMPSRFLELMIPQFLLFGLCSGKTATATVTLAGGVVFGSARTLGFAYAFTGTPTCNVQVNSVTLSLAGRTLAVTPVSDTGAAFTGLIPTAAGAVPVSATATINATFSASANGWCNSCLLPTPTVTTAVTIT